MSFFEEQQAEIIQIPARKKNSINFQEIILQSDSIQEQCQDFNVSDIPMMGNAEFFVDGCSLRYTPDTYDQPRSATMSKHAFTQLCNKLGIPARYIEKCYEAEMLELAEENVNNWLRNYDRDLFIREYSGNVRAVLSDRFAVLDTPDILSVLGDSIDFNQFNIKGHFISPERFHLRVVQKDMLKIKGEDLFLGMQIDSSDVGRNIVSAKMMIYKQVCTNGMTVSRGNFDLFKKRHIGSSIDFYNGFRDALSRYAGLAELLESAILNLITDSGELLFTHYDMRNRELSPQERMTGYFQLIRGFAKPEAEATSKLFFEEKYPVSNWGIVNSITEASQQFTLERRIAMESVAGDILHEYVA